MSCFVLITKLLLIVIRNKLFTYSRNPVAENLSKTTTVYTKKNHKLLTCVCVTAVWPKKIQSLDRKQPCKNTLKHNSSLLAFSLSLVGSFLWFFISSLSKALEGYLSKSSTSRLWWRSNRWEFSVVVVLSCH